MNDDDRRAQGMKVRREVLGDAHVDFAVAEINPDNEGFQEEVPMHFLAAITNGLTREEIREVILQVGLYRGVPVANHATALLTDTLEPQMG